jgi:hypothetical protein
MVDLSEHSNKLSLFKHKSYLRQLNNYNIFKDDPK